MNKILIVVDMQNDFITGSLGSVQAEKIVPYVKKKIEEYRALGSKIIFTRDTHSDNYLSTQEGRLLPVRHCIKGTYGYEITKELDFKDSEVYDKNSFGDIAFAEKVAALAVDTEEIELCGLCSDICVVSNALILKAALPEIKITVDAKACAGVSEESHQAALLTMKMCQVNIVNG